MTWQPIAVELVISAWIILLLSWNMLTRPSAKSMWGPALLGIAVGAGVWWWQRPWIGSAFDPMFTLDRFAWTFKGLFLLTAALVVLLTRDFTKSLTTHVGEFYLLIITALLGMLVLASINDLLLLFVGLELLTFSLYIMVAYLRRDARSVEAGMKYLIMGSISSGFLVYGVSLLYGMAGSTNFATLRAAFATGQMPALGNAGLLLVLAGLGFKVGAVPFHLWVPDVYEGAPTPVVALLSVGSKMAGVVALMRVLTGVFLPAHALWGPLLGVIAAATILYGNLGALPQTSIKRLMGYSSIGHAGYLLMGVSLGTRAGASAVAF